MASTLRESIAAMRMRFIAKVIGLLLARPDPTYKEATEHTGTGLRTVERIANRAGYRRREKGNCRIGGITSINVWE